MSTPNDTPVTVEEAGEPFAELGRAEVGSTVCGACLAEVPRDGLFSHIVKCRAGRRG